MRLLECEERITEYLDAEEDITLYGYCYIRGERFEAEDIEKIKNAKKLWEERKKEILNKKLTVEDCKRMLLLCREAEESVLAGKEYEMDGRHLTRADLSEILKLKRYYEDEIERLEAGLQKGRYAYRIMPYE